MPSTKDYDPEYQLSEGDVALDNLLSPTVVRLQIKGSKTDPFKKGVSIHVGKTESSLYPVVALTAYLITRGRSPGPFFIFRSGVPLSRECLARKVRQALSPSGVDVSLYSGHSFRIGAATTAASVGTLIKTLGRWESNEYQIYMKVPRDNLAAVSRRLVSSPKGGQSVIVCFCWVLSFCLSRPMLCMLISVVYSSRGA